MASEEVDGVDMQADDQHMSVEEDTRVVLRVQGKAFIPSHVVTASITQIWKAHFNGEWDTWTSVPQEERDTWFDAFKDMYRWDTKIHHRVKGLFKKFGSKSLRGFMSKARKHPEVKPEFMNLTAWQTLLRKWRLPEFIAKSKRGKAARKANKRLHTGGSISVVAHKMKLRDQLGRDPFAAETFSRTHKHKDGTFISSEAEETLEQYNDKYAVDDTIDAESGNVSRTYTRWADHVGIKNGSFYGGGSGVDAYILQGSDTNEPSPDTSSNQNWVGVERMVEEQQSELVSLRDDQNILKDTLDTQTQKLDKIEQTQASFGKSLRAIIGQEVGKVVAQEVRKVLSQELGKVVAQEVRKAISQELGKAIAQETRKALRQ